MQANSGAALIGRRAVRQSRTRTGTRRRAAQVREKNAWQAPNCYVSVNTCTVATCANLHVGLPFGATILRRGFFNLISKELKA